MHRTKRLQNRITTGRFTLPAAILIAAACWISATFLLPEVKTPPNKYPFWDIFRDSCIPAWADRLSSFVLYALIGYLLIQLNNTFAIIRMRASIQTAVYLLLVSVCPYLHTLQAGGLASAALLAALFFVFRSYQQAESTGTLFHAFVFIGLGSLLLPQLMLFMPVLWAGAYSFRSLHIKSLVASLVGWSVPYWFLLGYAFCCGQMELFYLPFKELTSFAPVQFDFEPWQQVLLAYLLVLFIVSAAHCFAAGYEDKIRTRNYLHYLILLSLCLFVYIGLQPASAHHLLPSLLICVSLLTGHLFMLTNSLCSNLFFICALAGLFFLFGFNVWTLL